MLIGYAITNLHKVCICGLCEPRMEFFVIPKPNCVGEIDTGFHLGKTKLCLRKLKCATTDMKNTIH